MPNSSQRRSNSLGSHTTHPTYALGAHSLPLAPSQSKTNVSRVSSHAERADDVMDSSRRGCGLGAGAAMAASVERAVPLCAVSTRVATLAKALGMQRVLNTVSAHCVLGCEKNTHS